MIKCPECHSSHTVKCGFKMTRSGRKQRRQCQNCGHSFYESAGKKGGKG